MIRRIATTTQQASRQIRDVLQSLLICELLAPPPRLWLVSGWIVDAPVIDNRGGEFSGLVADWPDARTGTRTTVKSSTTRTAFVSELIIPPFAPLRYQTLVT